VAPAETVILTTSDGVAIAADYWPGTPGTPGTTGTPGSGLAYVVGHGFTGSARIPRVQRISTQLAETGAAVLALDFRGHGRSGGRSTLGELEVHDLAAAVAFLRAAGHRPIEGHGPVNGHGAVAVLGWSMGASVVLRYAGRGGDVDAVVSISSPGHWWERGTTPMRLVHWAVETRAGRLVTRVTTRTRLAGDGWAPLPESPVEVVAGIAPRPLLIVHGDADRYFPVHHGRALAAAAEGSAYWLEPGMGHAEAATTPELIARIDGWVRSALNSPALDSTAACRLRP
jgi:pimeloyl-ACP methyl ester carboxylesterase